MSLTDTITSIDALVAASSAAVSAGDPSTALTKLRAARILFAAIPDTQGQASALRWRVTDIDAMIEDLRRTAVSSANGNPRGIRSSKIVYKRATGGGNGCD